MRVVIHQPDFMPWEGFFDKAYHADKVVLWTSVQFTRRDYQHRVKVDGEWVTLPIIKAPQKTPIQDIMVDGDRLEDALSAFTAKLTPEEKSKLWVLYRKGTYPLLAITVPTILMMATWLGMDLTKFRLMQSKNQGDTPEERLAYILEPYGSGEYLVGHGAANYLDASQLPGWQVMVPEFNREVSADSMILPLMREGGGKFVERFKQTEWVTYAT